MSSLLEVGEQLSSLLKVGAEKLSSCLKVGVEKLQLELSPES